MQQDGNDCASKLKARTLIRNQDSQCKECTQGKGWLVVGAAGGWGGGAASKEAQAICKNIWDAGAFRDTWRRANCGPGAGTGPDRGQSPGILAGARSWEGFWERKYLTGRSAWLIPRRKTSWARPRAAVRLRRMPCWLERRARRRVRKRKVIVRAAKVTPRATYVRVFSGKISPF